MKTLLFSFLLSCSFMTLIAQEQYHLILGNDTLNITTDQIYIHKMASGEEVMLRLIKQQVQTFKGTMINFDYPSDYTISKTDLGEGVQQIALLTADGNGYFIQEYATIDPSSLVNMMMTELTKESIDYGYKYSEETFEQRFHNNKLLIGRRRTLENQGVQETYTVSTYGENGRGILITTLTNNSGNKEETDKLINLLYRSLKMN